MKRIGTSILCILFMLCLSMGCFAAEDTLTNQKLSASHAVVANYVCDYSELDHYTTAEDEGGGVYTAETDTGLTVIIPEGKEGLTLVVHEVTEKDKEAAKWFKENFEGAKNIAPLEIFYIDANGNRINLPAGTEVILSGLKRDHYVVLLSADGKKFRLPAKVKDGAITFKTTAASDYVVVCTPGPQGGGANQPETGDSTPLNLWFTLMALSAAGMIIVSKKLKNLE